MKKYFKMLSDERFHLIYGVRQRFSHGPNPKKLRLNREGYNIVEGIQKNTLVYPYMRLSEHPSLSKGDGFSPIYGKIIEINERSIFIDAIEPDDDLLAQGKKTLSNRMDLFSLSETGSDLILVLKHLGLNTGSLAKNCETLIINGLNPDPGVTWAEPMLLTHKDTFNAGISMLRKLSPAKNIVLAIAEGMSVNYPDLEVVEVPAQYPASVNALLVKTITGEELPEHVGIVGLHNIWSLGRVCRTGLPLIETVITIGSYEHSGNYIVKEGSLIGELLEFLNIELKDGDTIVRGGPLRGESLDRLDRSLTKGSTGVFVVEAGTIPPMQGHSPCINCGACTLICPARLNPGNLSCNAEFALHERNRQENIFSCLECGLCGYVCIARRPVLQYIRLSRHKLASS